MATKDLTKIKKHLLLCNGGSCKVRGAEESTNAIRAELANHGLSEQVHTTKTLCNGRCKDGPIVISMPDGIWFQKMDKSMAADLVSQLLTRKIPLRDNILFQYGSDEIYSEEDVGKRARSGTAEYSAYY